MGTFDFEAGRDGVVDVEAAAMMYERIVLALRPDGETGEPSGTTVKLAWNDLRPLLPDSCVTDEGRAEVNSTQRTDVAIDDLYEQLRKGRVVVPVGRLVHAVPPRWVSQQARVEPALVELPLRLVVKAVPRGELKSRTTQQARAYRLDGLPNLFDQAPASALGDAPPAEMSRLAPPALSPPASQAAEPKIAVRFGLRQRGAAPVLPPLTAPPLPSPEALSMPASEEASLPEEAPSPEEILRMTKAVSVFKDIESALSGKHDVVEDLPSVDLRFDEILKLVPDSYVLKGLRDEDRDCTIKVVIEDLYEQLAQGRVAIPVSQLIYGVSPALLDVGAFEDASLVVIPLPVIVRALGPARFAERAAGKAAHYQTGNLPDLFAARDASPGESGPAAPLVRPSEVLVEGAEAEALGAINLNTATVESLRTLRGVTPRLAAAIVAYRAEKGPFKDIFDLFKVPRVGRKTFRAITGMPHSAAGKHRRLRLATLLRLPAERAAHLPTVAGCLAAAPGFAGCVISDADGLLLASAGADRWAVETSAVIPRLVSQVSENMKEAGAPTTEALTILSRGHMFTVVPGAHVFVTAIHDARRLTAAQLRFVQRVASEVQWLVSRRGYV